jgi:hypothetical protein
VEICDSAFEACAFKMIEWPSTLKTIGASAFKSCKFESITLCPYEKDGIDMEMLTDQELDHINNYHKKVYELVSPLVDEETKAWLDEACAEIQR